MYISFYVLFYTTLPVLCKSFTKFVKTETIKEISLLEEIMAKKRVPHLVDPAIIDEHALGEPQYIFANTLNVLMEEQGIDQEKMAADLGLSTGVIHNYRHGKTEPKLSSIIKIANYLNVDCHYLLTGIQSKYRNIEQMGFSAGAVQFLKNIPASNSEYTIDELEALPRFDNLSFSAVLETQAIVGLCEALTDCYDISNFDYPLSYVEHALMQVSEYHIEVMREMVPEYQNSCFERMDNDIMETLRTADRFCRIDRVRKAAERLAEELIERFDNRRF